MGLSNAIEATKVTAPLLSRLKAQKRPIVAVTCYDFQMSRLLNEAGVDLVLVGDSLGMVKLGYSSTLPVTLDDMAYHVRAVARGNSRALLVADMPYLSYHTYPEEAVRNAGALLKAGAEAVKIEGGREMVPALKALQAAKIPVIGHLGMTPQSVHVFGGYKVQGRTPAARRTLIDDARAIEKQGVSAIVLECLPAELARDVSRAIQIPTIGIGAGGGCDGQVIVLDDLLGLTPRPRPRFVKAYADLRRSVRQAVQAFAADVRRRAFPDDLHSYH